MATLGDLVVNLGMNSQKFNRGMDNAKEKVSKFRGFAKKSLIAGIGAGVAAAGVIAAKTMGQMQPLDEMAKTADKLGIAANKMGGLQLAFEQTGVSANAGMVAMQRMTRRIADAANGAGPAAKALQELGLNANQLKALSPDQALNQIADAMKGVEGQSDKVRLAFSLFDSEGVGLVNTLANGSEGLKAFQAEADKLNMNHTREELARIEAANDAMAKVSSAVTAMFQNLAIVAAPVIESIANMITPFAVSFGKTFTSVVQFILDGLNRVKAVFATVFSNFATIGDFVFTSLSLGAVVFANTLAHFFTKELPAFLSWFGRNFVNIFITAFDFVGTAWTNFSDNIKDNWKNVVDFIMGRSSKLEFAWKPLTDGFKSSMEKLDLPKREVGELEAQLIAEGKAIGEKLPAHLLDGLSSRLAELRKPADMQAEAGKVSAITQPTAPVIDTAGAKPTTDPRFAKAMTKGSGEAFKAILTAQQKKKDSNLTENKKQTKILEKQLDFAREQVKEPTFQVAVAAGF